jgi:hypothetical protein
MKVIGVRGTPGPKTPQTFLDTLAVARLQVNRKVEPTFSFLLGRREATAADQQDADPAKSMPKHLGGVLHNEGPERRTSCGYGLGQHACFYFPAGCPDPSFLQSSLCEPCRRTPTTLRSTHRRAFEAEGRLAQLLMFQAQFCQYQVTFIIPPYRRFSEFIPKLAIKFVTHGLGKQDYLQTDFLRRSIAFSTLIQRFG